MKRNDLKELIKEAVRDVLVELFTNKQPESVKKSPAETAIPKTKIFSKKSALFDVLNETKGGVPQVPTSPSSYYASLMQDDSQPQMIEESNQPEPAFLRNLPTMPVPKSTSSPIESPPDKPGLFQHDFSAILKASKQKGRNGS